MSSSQASQSPSMGADGCRRRECQFSSGMQPMKGCTYSSRYSHANAHTGTTKGTRCLKEAHEVGMNRGRGFTEDAGGEGNGVEYNPNVYLHV